MNRRRDTVEQVVIPFSDADPAVSRKRTPPAPAFGTRAGASAVKSAATALDDDEVRRVRLLLLGKAAVLAHRYERPLAAEMDEKRK